MAELSGHTVTYYGDIYRLSSENVLCGTVNLYCAPGALYYRSRQTSETDSSATVLAAVPATSLLNYDTHDRMVQYAPTPPLGPSEPNHR